MIVPTGATSQSFDVQIVDDTGLGVTGLVAATFPPVSWTLGGNTAATSITLSDLGAITSAYASGGVKERSGGWYRLDLPDAALASAGTVKLIGEASGKHLIAEPINVGAVPANFSAMRIDPEGFAEVDAYAMKIDAQTTPGTLTVLKSDGTTVKYTRTLIGDGTAAPVVKST